MMANRSIRPGLYAITDSRLTSGDSLVTAVEAALRGGATLVQYRDKQADDTTRLKQARDLAAACHNAGVPLIINDDPHLARRCGADGVHLGQQDSDPLAARRLLGDSALLGITCHGQLALAEKACADGADYLAFGRFYPSGTKPEAPEAEPGILGQARYLRLPITAIGGININNAEPLILAGADLLAVIGGLFSGPADLIESRARAFSRLFARHHPLFSQSSSGA
ncbi:thiamine phosphate synthase [Marinobacter sp.]|jgi:thiamine-phosphate pyrophosphorylase|uniref:thiamine phosphate synthase n=1 Tax=Marinobacter sp. TaxID=50741 RepID=UPI001993188C|nr:thiamine phosphate synthase [Marinobacter sp.]MBC7191657.1 thiamine phosphate synthase [Marinobacter sp.]